MQAFGYVAYTANGRQRRGSIVAESERDATRQLEAQGLFPSEISVQAPPTQGRSRRGRLDPDTRAVFTRQMAVLLASDLSAEAALDVVAQSADGSRLATYATRLKAEVLDGYPLSQAIERCGGGFERYYASALRAGESSGELAVVFEELATYLEGRMENRTQLASALIYPGFVAAVSLVVCAILVTTVAPEIVAMFEVSGRPLPQLTQIVLGIADWIKTHWILLLLGLAIAAFGAAALLRRPAVRARWDAAMLVMPLVGRHMRLTASAQYLRTLALVLASRQTVPDAAASASEVLAVARFRHEAAKVLAAVEAGEPLSAALRHLSPLPPVTRQLVSAGEKSARLARMTERAALLVETWRATERKRLVTVLDPILMMLVGVLVLTIVLAVLLPIFDLQATIG